MNGQSIFTMAFYGLTGRDRVQRLMMRRVPPGRRARRRNHAARMSPVE